MLLTNYHCHCYLCDGKGAPGEYAQLAFEQGYLALGFSSHAPIPFENSWTMNSQGLKTYLKEIEEVKRDYTGRMEIYRGLEIDYIPGMMGPSDSFHSSLPLDFRIGSVHVVPTEDNHDHYCFDGSDEEFIYLLNHQFKNNILAMVGDYYERVQEMLRQGGFDILGHFDLVKKKNRNNRFFAEEEPWYRELVETTLKETAKWGGILEVNTGGIARGAIDTVYPSAWILEKAFSYAIPITLNSDAHKPEDLGCYYPQATDIIKRAGYTTKWAILEGQWKEIAL